MKKIVKSIFVLVFTFLFQINYSYATTITGVTEGSYVRQPSGFGIGKVFLILVAICLVLLVLFIAYKMDEKEESEKRKKKIAEKNKAKNKTKLDVVDEESVKVSNFDYYYEQRENNTIEDIVNAAKEEKEKLANSDEKEIEEITIDDISDEELLENLEIDEEDIEEFSKSSSDTMVLNTNDLKKVLTDDLTMKFETEKVRSVEEIKEEDDEITELLEIEKTIKAANVKRYTRKKVVRPKRYTRKINVNKPAIRKRGRPHKIRTPEEIAEMERRAAEGPRKRGRKPGSKNKPKDDLPKKRGRKPGSKNKATAGPKRGRPRKNSK